MEYYLVSAGTSFSLSQSVEEKLNDGWELYGGPTCSVSRAQYSLDEVYCQAVIRKGPVVDMPLEESV